MAVGIVFGGPSPEHDVSILTGLQAARALGGDGRQVRLLYWSKAGEWYEVPGSPEADAFLEGVPRGSSELSLVAGPGGGFVARGGRFGRERKVEIEAAVVCCHGGPGEDGTLQGVLDTSGVRYTGPTSAGAALGMDKLAFGGLMTAAGLPTLRRALVTQDGFLHGPPGPGGPYIVKPRFGGSSIGIEVVDDAATASALARASRHLRRGGVVEQWRGDLADVNIAVRTWPALELSAIERPLRSSDRPILSYSDKYVGGQGMVSAPRELPADLPADTADRIRQLASSIVVLAGVRGVARIDFLVGQQGEIFVNEINTIPGSMAKYLWVQPAILFAKLLGDMLDEATGRPSVSYSSEGADGTALRSAGSIASKLA